MNRSKTVLSVCLAAAIVVTGISVMGISAANKGAEKSASKSTPEQAGSSPHHYPMQGRVDNLEKTSSEANRISLKWSESPDATGYYVYVCDKDAKGSYTLFSDVSKPAAELMNLKDTTAYGIKVTAYRNSNGVIYESAPTVLDTATQAADVAALDSLRSSDVLKFCWPPSDGVTGYDVYRASKDTKSEYVLYKTLDNTKMDFEDKDVKEGEFYSYKLCPFRTVNDVKYPAKGKTIDFISGLSAPGDLIARSGNTRVTLSWKDKDIADGYNVYISTSEKSGFSKLGSTDEDSYSTDKLEAGKTYYFRVQPYKKMSDGTVATGTWSTCKIKAAEAEETTRSAPKSSITGSGTYVEISIAQQHMWFYEKGKLFLDTDIVTGNEGNCDTPTGTFSIESRALDTTLTGDGYSSFVSYWMGFYGGYGIHDASWRSSFGGDIYQGNGSHGCVNTPYEKVKQIYEHTDYGTPVYIY